MNIAVVPARGLGDALIFMVLSHNLRMAGHNVVTVSGALAPLASWFPGHTILPSLPPLETFDQIFAQDHTPPLPRATVVREATLDKSIPYVANMTHWVKRLGIASPTLHNGITPPSHLKFRAHKKRVLIHPLSTEKKRDWTRPKTTSLIAQLTRHGWDPKVCLAPHQRAGWQVPLTPTDTLCELAAYMYESHGLIGVNSGLGHLAACLGLPTLSLFSRQSYARLWRPGWGNNRIVTPLPLLPGVRLKEKTWKALLSPRRIAHLYHKQTKEL